MNEQVMKKIEELRVKAKRSHTYCEDSWYSCPKAEDGSCNENYEEDECNCGADSHNTKIDNMIDELIKII